MRSKMEIAQKYINMLDEQEINQIKQAHCPKCKIVSASVRLIPPGDPVIRNLNRVIAALNTSYCPACGCHLADGLTKNQDDTKKKLRVLMGKSGKGKEDSKSARGDARAGSGRPRKEGIGWQPVEIISDQEYSCMEAERIAGPNQPLQQQRLKAARESGELPSHQGPRNQIMVWGRDLKAWLRKHEQSE